MAKKTTEITDDAPKKKSGVEKHLAVWLLLAMIVTGLGGWGVTNFGSSVTAIGTVGDREMTAQEYARSLRAALSNFSRQIGTEITLEQAQAFGMDRQVLQGMVLRTALDSEADRLGLSVGDAIVADQVKANKAFQGVEGFDRAIYRDTLQRNGLTEEEYESSLRADSTRQILTGAVQGGMSAPSALVDAVYAYRQEKRGFTVLELGEAALATPIPAATDDQLKTYYDAHIEAFTRPAGKRITYAALLPDTLAGAMTVADADVQAAYDARADQYNIPEKRLVERLVYPTEDEAKAAKARLDAGEATFEDLVKERGLDLQDIDMGDVSQADLGEAGAAVFALTENGVAGPLPSAVGPALYRLNGILEAQVTTLDQAKPDLVKELQIEAAKKAITDRVEAIDDALAGGATLEDLAKEQGMTLVTTDYAPGADDNDPLSADKGWAEEAGKIAVGDYPEAVVMENGGLVAMRVDEDLAAAPIPLEKIRDKVEAAWHAQELQTALAALADEVKGKIDGGASLGAFGITTRVAPVTRDVAPTEWPGDVTQAVFAMAAGEVREVVTPGWVGLVRLDEVEAAPTEGDDAKALRDQISAEIRQGLGQDLGDLYGQAILKTEPVALDQAAINAVNASFR